MVPAWCIQKKFGMLDIMNIEVQQPWVQERSLRSDHRVQERSLRSEHRSELQVLDVLAAELERVAQKIVIGALAQTIVMARKIANTVSDGAFGLLQEMTEGVDEVDFDLIAKIEARAAETGTPLQDFIGDAASGLFRTATAPLALTRGK